MYIIIFLSPVIFVAGTKFYVNKKPTRASAGLYLNVPLSIGVCTWYTVKDLLQFNTSRLWSVTELNCVDY